MNHEPPAVSQIAIRVEGLGKCYRLGQQVGYKTLREGLFLAYHTPTRAIGEKIIRMRQERERRRAGAGASGPPSPVSRPSDHLWALKDVSFEVKRGEAIGIIGRNGSGKSTLLKILSRITAPTEGRAEIHGRVGSLLEVGTGFHPELTGRENIYLNGAIIGMKKGEIERKFDEIVAFAEIERFLDTPVKRYSSGMYVRLAFAVAAHLEPEILIVDEVLAVGDAQFQKKCLGKMSDVARGGRTVLFVSHNMPAVIALCNRALLLVEGHAARSGDPREIIDGYLSSAGQAVAEVTWNLDKAPGGETSRLRAVRVKNSKGEIAYVHDLSQPIALEMDFCVLRPDSHINPAFHVYNQQGTLLFSTWNITDPQWSEGHLEPGLYQSTCQIPAHYLNDGVHRITAVLVENRTMREAFVEGAVSFEVRDDGSDRGLYTGGWGGVIRPVLPWTLRQVRGLS
jgi:lipopolysaccharide transport system ATP-binding protein